MSEQQQRTRAAPERAWRERGIRPRVLALLDPGDWEMRTDAGLLVALLESEFEITLADPREAAGDRQAGLIYALDWRLLERLADPQRRPRIACVGPLGDLDPEALGRRLEADGCTVQALTARTARRLSPHVSRLVQLPRPTSPLLLACIHAPATAPGVLRVDDPARRVVSAPAGVEPLVTPAPPAGSELERRIDDLQQVDACIVEAADGASPDLLRASCTGRAIVVAGSLDPELGLSDGREILWARDDAALARALERLRDDPVLRRQLALAARVWVERRFGWSAHLQGHRELLHSGLEAGAPRSAQAPRATTSSCAVGRGAAAL